MINRFSETFYDCWVQTFDIDEVYYHKKTDHQDLIIFHNAMFGRVMALDGIIQTTEKDEFVYHEMLAHVPIFAKGDVKRVLIIGGGDGGMLREVLRHQSIEQVTQVEIDGTVIELCKEFLPNHSQGAFDNSRAKIIIQDGLEFVKNTEEKFDVIISDSTDPIGPGEVLFSNDYYKACHRCLTPGGILVTQNGALFSQIDESVSTGKHFNAIFQDWHFYMAAVPTYIGGDMAFGFATDEPRHRNIDLETLEKRFKAADIKTRYYNPRIHLASFALPQYALEKIGKS